MLQLEFFEGEYADHLSLQVGDGCHCGVRNSHRYLARYLPLQFVEVNFQRASGVHYQLVEEDTSEAPVGQQR
jgi:hypothetical protein